MHDAVEFLCDQHPDRHDCPDCLLEYIPKYDEYGILVHDGGTSKITIEYCPWCGAKLPDSKRDKWFEELETLGITNPGQQEIPKEYDTDEWYRQNE